MLYEFEGIRDAFGFNVGWIRTDSGSDGSHSSRLLVCKTLVGHLDAIRVVINGLLRFLVQIGEIRTGSFCRMFWFIDLKEFVLEGVPVIGVDSVLSKTFKPSDGLV